jgi:hypothetical protein
VYLKYALFNVFVSEENEELEYEEAFEGEEAVEDETFADLQVSILSISVSG